jgi:hypothetical protein
VPTTAGTHRPTETSHATRFRAALAAGLAALLVFMVLAVLVQMARPGYLGMGAATGQVAALADEIRRGDPAPSRAPAAIEDPAAEPLAPTLHTTTRFPLFAAMVAALRDAGLTWRGALRAGSLLGALLLLAAVALGAWRLGAGRTGVLLAVALMAAQHPFKDAALAGRADLLAAAFSAAAFAAWLRDEDLREWWTPLFAALAALLEATAVTVPLAILFWALATRRPRDLARFLLRAAAVAAAGLVCTIPFDGPARYLDALRTQLALPLYTAHPLRGPAEMLRTLGSYAEWLVALAIALYAACLPGWRQRPVVWWIGVAFAFALVVLCNRGADESRLLELMAAAAIMAGAWAAPRSGLVSGVAVVLVVLAIAAGSWRDVQDMNRRARQPADRRAEVTAAVGAARGEVFVEDPLVAIAARRRAPVADPATLRALARRGDPRATAMTQALREGRFALVVLDEDAARERRRWYRDIHLGEDAIEAIRSAYVLDGEADGFYLYRPAP